MIPVQVKVKIEMYVALLVNLKTDVFMMYFQARIQGNNDQPKYSGLRSQTGLELESLNKQKQDKLKQVWIRLATKLDSGPLAT